MAAAVTCSFVTAPLPPSDGRSTACLRAQLRSRRSWFHRWIPQPTIAPTAKIDEAADGVEPVVVGGDDDARARSASG